MSGFLLTTASVLRFNALQFLEPTMVTTSRWIILTENEPIVPNAIPYQTRFDKVGKSRFHHFNDGGNLIITTPHKIGPRA